MRRLTILTYHRVRPAPDSLMADVPDAARFEAEVAFMRQWFDLLPLGEAVERLRGGRMARPVACLTFDDGYADNAEVALPILRRLGVRATFFVSTGFLGGGCMWNDRAIEAIRCVPPGPFDLEALGLGRPVLGEPASRRSLIDRLLEKLKYLPLDERLGRCEEISHCAGLREPPALMMSVQQVRLLREAGMEIGAHTVNHPILTRLAPAQAEQEIVGSRVQLEEILREPVRVFAYPNGRPGQDYAAEHVEMVRAAGFAAAVSTALGVATPRSDRLQLPRFAPWPKTRLRLGLELARNFTRTSCEAV
jgi:peptidoglycan/xylan/chitin deacetylase (PgdA/CDA1 family)